MAVLHYPIEPYAYWTFDRHEALFENNQSARYQPSPVWNRQFFFNDLLHRWTFDEENGSVIANVNKDLNFTVPFASGLKSDWGLQGRALEWNSTQADPDPNKISFLSALPDDNLTLSFWARPNDAFTITLGDSDITLDYDLALNKSILKSGNSALAEIVRENPQFNDWVHFALSINRKEKQLNLCLGWKTGSGHRGSKFKWRFKYLTIQWPFG